MGYYLKRSTAAKPLLFLMIDAADHLTGKTGLAPTVVISKNGGAFAAPAGAVTELANGWYQVAANATDNGALGPLLLHATASGADPCDEVYAVVAFDPDDNVGMGLSRLDAAISSRMATFSYTAPPSAAANAAAARVELSTELARLDAAVSSRLASGSYSVAPSAAANAAAVRAELAAELARVDADISSRLPAGSYAAPPSAGANAAAVRAELATELAHLDAAVSSRLSAAGYTAPPAAAANASAVRSELATELAMLDVATSSRLAADGYTAPDNAGIAATLRPTTPGRTLAVSEEGSVTAGVTLTAEDIESIAEGISSAGVTVSELMTAALAQIRQAMIGAIVPCDPTWREGALEVWLGDRYGSAFNRPIERVVDRVSTPWLQEGAVELRVRVRDTVATLAGVATFISETQASLVFGALAATWQGLPCGQGDFRIVQVEGIEIETITSGRVTVRPGF